MSDLPHFAYSRPRDLDEARSALARPGARVYAGGSDLLVALGARRPWTLGVRELVDVKDLEAANGVRELGNELRVGALVTAAALASNRLLRRHAPCLSEAAAATAAPALRRRATVGGNIVTVHPAGDVATALLALGATVEITDERGEHELPLSTLMEARADAWPQRRLVLAVRFRKCRNSAFEKLGSRTGFGRSVVAAAVALDAERIGVARGSGRISVALGGLGDRPLLATATAAAMREDCVELATPLALECRPPDDGLTSAAYRLRVAAVLIGRAQARARAASR